MNHRAIVVTDLLFGDSGKGTTVDFYARQLLAERGAPPLVVRFSGGAQAAHAVVTEDGRSHVFSQFGAASFVEGAATHLAKSMLVNPVLLLGEARRLAQKKVFGTLGRLTLHESALVTTPFHVALNRIKERKRGDGAHGSCGLGIGETRQDSLLYPKQAIRARHLQNSEELEKRLRWLLRHKRAQAEALDPEAPELADLTGEELAAFLSVCAELISSVRLVGDDFLANHLSDSNASTLFEGAQGVLLDEWRGFHPYTTWSNVTAHPALRLLKNSGADVLSLGVIRGYATRHGAGPFPTEDPQLTELLPDATNPENAWQGKLRVGWPDLALLRYALKISGRIDALAVTCLDRMERVTDWRIAESYDSGEIPTGRKFDLSFRETVTRSLFSARPGYRAWTSSPDAHARNLAQSLGLPLALTSWGPAASDKRTD
jgi:adenylosuccinate synthase